MALRVNKRATLFDLGNQRGQVEVEYPPNRKLLWDFSFSRLFFFQKGYFLTERPIFGRFIFLKLTLLPKKTCLWLTSFYSGFFLVAQNTLECPHGLHTHNILRFHQQAPETLLRIFTFMAPFERCTG